MIRLLFSLLLFLSCPYVFAQVHVRGYYRSNGTYVQPHERTRPNNTIIDNYSYPGNYNPNSGRITGGSTTNTQTSIPTTTYSTYTPTLHTFSEPSSIPRNNTTVSSANLSTPAISSSQLYAETEPNASLKKEPRYTAISTYAIPNGTIVKVSKYNENYYLAEVDGRNGYICACQVKNVFTKP